MCTKKLIKENFNVRNVQKFQNLQTLTHENIHLYSMYTFQGVKWDISQYQIFIVTALSCEIP